MHRLRGGRVKGDAPRRFVVVLLLRLRLRLLCAAAEAELCRHDQLEQVSNQTAARDRAWDEGTGQLGESSALPNDLRFPSKVARSNQAAVLWRATHHRQKLSQKLASRARP